MSRAPADQRRRAAALPFLQSDLQSSLGFRVSRVTARAFVVEAIDAIMDENGLLQGHRGYRNPTLSVGDQLVAVEGYDAEEMEYNTPGSIQAVFKGPRGSCVELTFLSEKTGDEFNIRVKRHVVDQLVRATKDQAKPGSSCGVGVLLGRPYNQDDFHDVTVLDLVDGGSAQRSGKIDIGDELQAVGKLHCYGQPLQVVTNAIVGAEGSRVSLRIRKKEENFVRLVQLKREGESRGENSETDEVKELMHRLAVLEQDQQRLEFARRNNIEEARIALHNSGQSGAKKISCGFLSFGSGSKSPPEKGMNIPDKYDQYRLKHSDNEKARKPDSTTFWPKHLLPDSSYQGTTSSYQAQPRKYKDSENLTESEFRSALGKTGGGVRFSDASVSSQSSQDRVASRWAGPPEHNVPSVQSPRLGNQLGRAALASSLASAEPPKQGTKPKGVRIQSSKEESSASFQTVRPAMHGDYWCKTLTSYQARHPDELSFVKGQLIEVQMEQPEPGWYFGTTPTGEVGLVPMTHVRIVAVPSAPSSLPASRLSSRQSSVLSSKAIFGEPSAGGLVWGDKSANVDSNHKRRIVEKLRRFYSVHNPELILAAEEVAGMHNFSLDHLNRALFDKYGADLLSDDLAASAAIQPAHQSPQQGRPAAGKAIASRPQLASSSSSSSSSFSSPPSSSQPAHQIGQARQQGTPAAGQVAEPRPHQETLETKQNEVPPHPCSRCGAEPGSLDQDGNPRLFRRCKRCRQADYCSEECQRAHWACKHKAECHTHPHGYKSFNQKASNVVNTSPSVASSVSPPQAEISQGPDASAPVYVPPHFEEQLRRLYEIHAPDKTRFVKDILAIYANNIPALNQALLSKYGACIDPNLKADEKGIVGLKTNQPAMPKKFPEELWPLNSSKQSKSSIDVSKRTTPVQVIETSAAGSPVSLRLNKSTTQKQPDQQTPRVLQTKSLNANLSSADTLPGNRSNISSLESNAIPQPTKNPADIRMLLDLDFSAVGSEGSPLRAGFTQSLTQDLSNATNVHPANFHVLKMAPGSIILDIQIESDPLGRGPVPLMVAKDLQMQVRDPSSPLLNGKLTSYAKSITLLGSTQPTFDNAQHDPGLAKETDSPTLSHISDLPPALPVQYSPFSGKLQVQPAFEGSSVIVEGASVINPAGHLWDEPDKPVAGYNSELLAALLEEAKQAELEAELAEEEYNRVLQKSVGMLALNVSEQEYYESLIDDVRQAQMDADAAGEDNILAMNKSAGAPLQGPYFVDAQVENTPHTMTPQAVEHRMRRLTPRAQGEAPPFEETHETHNQGKREQEEVVEEKQRHESPFANLRLRRRSPRSPNPTRSASPERAPPPIQKASAPRAQRPAVPPAIQTVGAGAGEKRDGPESPFAKLRRRSAPTSQSAPSQPQAPSQP